MDNGQRSPEAPYDDATIYHGTPVGAVEREGEGVETEVSSQGQPLVPPENETRDPSLKSSGAPEEESGPVLPPIPLQPVDEKHGKGEPVGNGEEPVDDQEPEHGIGKECVDDQELQHRKGEECGNDRERQHVQGQEQLDECLAETTGPSDADLEKFFASLPETHPDLQDFAGSLRFSETFKKPALDIPRLYMCGSKLPKIPLYRHCLVAKFLGPTDSWDRA